MSEFNHITEGIDVNSKESVNSCVNSFTDLLNSAAEPLFHKTVNVNDNIGTINTKAEWFDAECAAAKFEYKKALHNFYRVKSIHSRNDMCNKKLCYKKLIKKKKNEYKVMLSNKMEALKYKLPKEFWSFFSKIRGRPSQVIYLMRLSIHILRIYI